MIAKQAAIKVSGENKSNQVATQRFSYHKRQKVNINLNSFETKLSFNDNTSNNINCCHLECDRCH